MWQSQVILFVLFALCVLFALFVLESGLLLLKIRISAGILFYMLSNTNNTMKILRRIDLLLRNDKNIISSISVTDIVFDDQWRN